VRRGEGEKRNTHRIPVSVTVTLVYILYIWNNVVERLQTV
jgi:hypothetical protein